MEEPRADAVAAWIELVSTSRGLVEAVEARLKAADLPPLGWYDVLLELEKAGEAGLRPFELQARLLLPQYGVSRLLDRIEAVGLIHRAPCGDDRRGHVVRLTDAGQAMRRRAWPVYAGALRDLVEARLDPDAAVALTQTLRRLRGA